MVRAIPGRLTFQQIARRELRGFAVRTLRGLGDAVLTNSLVQLAQNAGFSGNDALTAAAIALAESSGVPTKYNAETQAGTPLGKGSFGLWQIYLYKHPQFSGWNLYDPQTNANAAFQVYQSEGFRAWTTYKTGAYLKYLPQAVPAATPEPPLTIDNNTGQVITDSTPTPPPALPDDDVTAASILPLPAGVKPGNVLLLTGLAVGAYLLADTLFGD